MTRDWKPGDVAVVTYKKPDMREPDTGRAIRWQNGWIYSADDGYEVALDRAIIAVRPVVVIDPEDRDQVERLARAWNAQVGNFDTAVERMGNALRSLIAPPKPEEPTGLGAVVEDADGRRWVRKGDDDAPDRWAMQVGFAFCSRDYDRINAVRVLSEGWSE